MKHPTVHSPLSMPAPALHNFNGAADLAAAVLVCLGIGATIGLALAIYQRRRQLAWTWGLLALLPVQVGVGLVAGDVLSLREAAGFLALGFGLVLRR